MIWAEEKFQKLPLAAENQWKPILFAKWFMWTELKSVSGFFCISQGYQDQRIKCMSSQYTAVYGKI